MTTPTPSFRALSHMSDVPTYVVLRMYVHMFVCKHNFTVTEEGSYVLRYVRMYICTYVCTMQSVTCATNKRTCVQSL